jgi:hypothetical protein
MSGELSLDSQFRYTSRLKSCESVECGDAALVRARVHYPGVKKDGCKEAKERVETLPEAKKQLSRNSWRQAPEKLVGK